MLDKLKSIVSVVAPTLAQGLANPAGAISGMALNAIADKLGIELQLASNADSMARHG